LFLADEPAASLDPSIADEMMIALSNQAKETNATLLFATHNLEHALKFSDRILAIGNRRILMDGATSGLRLEELRTLYD
jgi:phosphonate transport system ATP-binding protein